MRRRSYTKGDLNFGRWFSVLALVFLTLPLWGQQDPMYTQYMFNTQTINPAYAGTWDRFGFQVLARTQWVGIDGAPTTYTFSLQAPLRGKGGALGLNLISDKVGLEKRMGVYGDYSYRIRVSNESFLRLGLKFGFSNYSNNLNDYTEYPEGPPDPAFQGVIEEKYLPNFGFGAFLYNDRYYVGLSAPKLIERSLDHGLIQYSSKTEVRHFFLIAGYVFDLSNDVKFKPTLLSKAVVGAPVEFDFTANFLLKEKVWLGGMYRTGDGVGLIAQLIFDRNVRIGYAYDYSFNNLQRYHGGSHEIMISYELGRYRRRWSTPRMF